MTGRFIQCDACSTFQYEDKALPEGVRSIAHVQVGTKEIDLCGPCLDREKKLLDGCELGRAVIRQMKLSPGLRSEPAAKRE